MSWKKSPYKRFEQHPEEVALSPISKQAQSVVTHAEQNWTLQGRTPRSYRFRSWQTLLREWKWEFATWLLGSCAVGSIVALLVLYQDRPLRDWTPHVRPAPVIAALSQVAQSALLFSVSSCIGQLKWDWLRQKRSAADLNQFEDASRGPKGSLMLLPKTRLNLVSVGALATVLLLIFSPSTQLSNTIKVRNVDSTDHSSNATISRSVQYMSFLWNTTLIDHENHKSFNTSSQGVGNIHPHMFKAILGGVLDEQKSLSDITGNCQAEACRWNDYTTLAVCAAIEDISSSGEVRNNSNKVSGFHISGVSWQPPSQGLSIQDTFWMAAPFKDSSNITGETLAPIADVFLAYYPQCNHQNQSRGDEQWRTQLADASNWKAYKGTLSLCLQTLRSTYNNTMTTTIINTQKDLKWKSHDRLQLNGSVCLSQPYKGDSFCVSEDNLQQWSTSLARTLEGAASITSVQQDADNYYTGQWVPNIVGDVIGPSPSVCDANIGPGYGLEGFTRRINNIATAMTNAMRTGNTTSPDSIVHGSEWTSEQYIAVDFKWLTPPGAIYIAITLFFFATIIKSRKGDVPLWKSSPLVLLHSVEHNNGMQTLKQVEAGAKETRVQLQYTGENWHLQDVTGRHT